MGGFDFGGVIVIDEFGGAAVALEAEGGGDEGDDVERAELFVAAGADIAFCIGVLVHFPLNVLDDLVHAVFDCVDGRAEVDVVVGAVDGALLVFFGFESGMSIAGE